MDHAGEDPDGESGIPSQAESIVKVHSDVSQPADGVIPEKSETEVFSFVVRIWKQAGLTGPRYLGIVIEKLSRKETKETPFVGLDGLLSVIAGRIGIPTPWEARRQNCLRRWRARVVGWLARGKQG